MATDDTFFGIYNRKGELEAVESTALAAFATACNLSPGKDGKAPNAPIGRTVEPVTIIRGDLGTAFAHMLVLVTDASVNQHFIAYSQALAAATVINDKGVETVIATNRLLEATGKLRAALALKDAVTL